MRIPALLACLSLFASTAAAQDLLRGVSWRRLPTAAQMDELTPADLRMFEFSARAMLECTLRDGKPSSCVVVEEDPEGFGIGQAALQAAAFFEAAPRTRSGARTEGGRVRLPIIWDASPSGEAHVCAAVQLVEDAAAAGLTAPPADKVEQAAAALALAFPSEYGAPAEAARGLARTAELMSLHRHQQPAWRRAFALCRERQPVWLTRAEPAAYQPPTGTPPAEITRPMFVAVGEPPRLDRYYPARARAEGVGGEAEVRCVANEGGMLRDCRVMSESPASYGFGEAVARFAGALTLTPRDRDGWPVAGRWIRIKHAFDPARPARAAAAPAEQGVVHAFQAERDFTFTGGLLERMRFRAGEVLPVIGRRRIDGVTYAIIAKDRKYAVLVGPDGALHPKVYNAIGWNNRVGTMVWNFKANPPDVRLTPIAWE